MASVQSVNRERGGKRVRKEKMVGNEIESLTVLHFLTLEYLLTLFNW